MKYWTYFVKNLKTFLSGLLKLNKSNKTARTAINDPIVIAKEIRELNSKLDGIELKRELSNLQDALKIFIELQIWKNQNGNSNKIKKEKQHGNL